MLFPCMHNIRCGILPGYCETHQMIKGHRSCAALAHCIMKLELGLGRNRTPTSGVTVVVAIVE